MTRICFLLATCMATMGAIAQENATIDILPVAKKVHKNEIGLLGETPFGNSASGNYLYAGSGSYQGRVAIQYKRWVKENMGYRASLGYADYSGSSGRNYIGKKGDTTFQSFYRNRVPVVFGSIGVEMQRQFYKRVYLYAAVDLQVGYGNGTNESVRTTEVLNNNNLYDHRYYNETITSTASATVFNAGVVPFVGAKFNFSRISFGTELSGIRMEYNSVTSALQPMPGGVGEFSLGDFRQRFFVNYRF